MASIFKRKRSRFWYVKYHVNGQQVYKSPQTTSKRAALRLKDQIEADEVRGDLVAPSRTPLPEFLGEFCQFLATVRTPKPVSAVAEPPPPELG